MNIIEVDLPTVLQQINGDMVSIVERICLAESLTVTLRGTLASYSGPTHWHFKNGKARGTLELTWWPARNRLWFKVAGGRAAPWIEACLPRLKAKLEQALDAGQSAAEV